MYAFKVILLSTLVIAQTADANKYRRTNCKTEYTADKEIYRCEVHSVKVKPVKHCFTPDRCIWVNRKVTEKSGDHVRSRKRPY